MTESTQPVRGVSEEDIHLAAQSNIVVTSSGSNKRSHLLRRPLLWRRHGNKQPD